jgi:hypothetical protein
MFGVLRQGIKPKARLSDKAHSPAYPYRQTHLALRKSRTSGLDVIRTLIYGFRGGCFRIRLILCF